MSEIQQDDLVTVAYYFEPAEAQLAQSVLEGAGISSFLAGAESNIMLPPVSGARLQVRLSDEATARILLGNTAELAPGEALPSSGSGNDV